MKKRFATALLAGALSTSMVMPALASGVVPSNTGTDVIAGIMIQDKNPVVKVEVPTMFAFVVNGTTDTTDTTSVSSTNGNIYLPNVKVEVDTTSTPNAVGGYAYSLTYTGDGDMKMNNYSTYEAEETISGANVNVRKGLPLTINGEIQEASTVPANQRFWQYSATAATGNRADFKKYRLSVDGIDMTTVTTNGYKMASDITLTGPSTGYVYDPATASVSYTNLDTTTNLAVSPTTHLANFNVIVGGERGQYSQVEQSAKIGTIVWTVSADISLDGVETAPNNNYLAIDPSSSTNDTTPTAP